MKKPMKKSDLKVIAKIETDFPTKFGIPRQSGLIPELRGRIIFEPEYRNPEALRGIEGYSHLWLLWEFSEVSIDNWSPTVRPPRLGGNKRMGVFATRSPYRPNPIGLSSVELVAVEKTKQFGTVLRVKGADLLDGTPILDIKPYLAFTDSHEAAKGGFADTVKDYSLTVNIPDDIAKAFSADELESLSSILSQDPRPSYQNEADRVYGMRFNDCEIKFSVDGDILAVISAEKQK